MSASTLQSKLREIFAKYPDKPAIEYGDREISYSLLDIKSSAVAGYLVSRGIQKGMLIGILLDNKAELIFAIIGILKAGCVFVPLDSSYPDKRLENMLVTSSTVFVFSDKHHSRRLENIVLDGNRKVEIISLEEVFQCEGDLLPTNATQYLPGDMVYIYFTSGTTGKPKAIAGQNQGLLHFINWEIEAFNITDQFRISQFTPQCHDPFIRDIFVPLCTGGTICIPVSKEIILETNSMINWIERSTVDLIHCTPGLFSVFNSGMLKGSNFRNLKYILLAGEKLIPGELARWYQIMGERIQLVNVYGPTETTLAKLFYLIQPLDVKRRNKTIPIGIAIKGSKVIVLNKDMDICSQGEMGEIFIRTPYRTLGYLNDPNLNHSKFIANPFNHDPGDLIYKTGDLGRVLPEGNIEFMGRVDRQIKLRGFRVELSEIENELLNHQQVNQCVVDFKEDEPSEAEEFRLCKKCGLPSSYPETAFNYEGTCNICQMYENFKHKADSYFKTMNDLRHIFAKAKNQKTSQYDCLLLYSGGKDSTYVLYQLVDMGLNVLAYTFDNGFISQKALKNTKTIVNELKVDHIIDTSEKMNFIFRAGLKTENSVCNGCFKVLRRKSTKMAYEKGIKYIVTGFSRGQIYDLRLYDIYKIYIFDEKSVEEKILEQRLLYHSQKDYVVDIIGDSGIDRAMLTQVGLIDFYRYSNVTKEEILEFLKQRSPDWNNPLDTGFCSSNCLINDVGIHMQRMNHRYDNYTFPNSWEVRTGHMSLAEARKEFTSEIDVMKVQRILKQLDYNQYDIGNDYVKTDAKGYLAAYFVSEKNIQSNELKEHLGEKLPGYMIPPYFVKLDRIPLTPNGKIDYSALPDPKKHLHDEYIAPGTPIEKKLAKIWCDILGVERVGVNENFLHVGGHSLSLMNLISRIYKEFDVEIPLGDVFYNATLQGIANYIEEGQKGLYLSIEPVEKKEYYPLSSAQMRLFILHQMDIENISYNLPRNIQLKEEPILEKLEESFKKLIQRHESLRTSFHLVNDTPVQKINDSVEFEIEQYQVDPGASRTEQTELPPIDDLSRFRQGPNTIPPEIEKVINQFVRPFDLSVSPMLRAGLARIGERQYLLLVDMHHIIADGGSTGILLSDFMALYMDHQLTELPIQYKEFSEWQNREEVKEAIKKQEDHWLKEFAGDIPLLNLPTDYPRPLVQSFEGSSIHFVFTEKETRALKSIAKEINGTLYMCILSVYTVLLSKLSGNEDIIVGTPIAARKHTDIEHIIGMFANTLAMRNYPSGEKTFKEFLIEVKERTLKAFENQEYPFEDLVENLPIRRDISRNPIFDVMFNLLNRSDHSADIPIVDVQDGYEYEHRRSTSKFDMNLSAVDNNGKGLYFDIEYCTKLFKASTIERIIEYFRRIVVLLSVNTEQKLSDIEIITEEEKARALEMSRGVEEALDIDKTIHRWFEDRAVKSPDSIALVGPGPGCAITYRELNEKSNQLARVLMERGVTPDTVVGLMVERSFEMISGILAVLKAGGAYLPIDKEYPGERKNYMLKNSQVKLLLTNYDTESLPGSPFEEIEIININDECIYCRDSGNPKPMNTGSNLIYVIYTSGSTGKPKGVMLEHRNLVNLIRYQYKYTNLDFSSVLQFAAISFDVSAQEIFSTLLAGGKLSLIDKETRNNIPELFKVIEKNDIKTLFLPTAFLKFIFKEKEYMELIPASVKHIAAAGEQLIISDNLKGYLKANNVYLHNHYGPTETHVVTALTLGPKEEIPEIPSIGKPILNTDIFILDKEHHLLPIGIPGELYIGGIQVGRGYFDRPQLTAERFCLRRPGGSFCKNRPLDPHKNFLLSTHPLTHLPYLPYSTIYRTGDFARWLSDGNIEFLGRIDHQVKIRGFRVELGEIERQLLQHNKINESLVLAREDNGDRYLCAYVVSDEKMEVSELRDFLSNKLPDYMIPAYFVWLDKLPLTPNGKIDRNALPVPVLEGGDRYVAPRNQTEEKLMEIWSEVLGTYAHASVSIGIDDNFFQLGGHSLKATILASKLYKTLNVKVPLVEIFKKPTIRELCKYIETKQKDRHTSIEKAEKKDYYALSSAQKRIFFLNRFDNTGISYNVPFVYKMEGELDIERFTNSIRALMERHESLRTSFELMGEEPVQRIHDEVEFEIEYDNLATDKENYKLQNTNYKQIPNNNETAAHHSSFIIHHSFISPFDFNQAPLIRVGLIQVHEEEYILMLDIHHIITDGLSMDIFAKEMMLLYKNEELPPLTFQYKDYAQWQNKEKQGESIKQQEKYWLKELEGKIPVLKLPIDYPRPEVQSFEGGWFQFEISAEDSRALKPLILAEEVTLYMMLLALYNIFLAKVCNQEDIIIGTPIAGRRHADLENIIGMFVNTLPLRNTPTGDKSFKDFLKEIKSRTLEAFENQDYQYEDLVDAIAAHRDTSRNPLFDTSFTLQNTDTPEINIPGLKLFPYDFENKTSKFDLTLISVEEEEQLSFTFEHCTTLFKNETIQTLSRYFKAVVSSVLNDPGIKISDINILSEEEKHQLLAGLNKTREPYPHDKTIVELFQEQVKETPDHIALAAAHQLHELYKLNERENILLTYRELSEQSRQLAHRLREKGVQPGMDTMIGIIAACPLEMVKGILAIMKSGGLYVPLEPGTPPWQLNYILKDSGCQLLVTDIKDAPGLNLDIPLPILDMNRNKIPTGVTRYSKENVKPMNPPGDTACLLYESDPSGFPRGLMITQQSLVNVVENFRSQYENHRQWLAALTSTASGAPGQKDLTVDKYCILDPYMNLLPAGTEGEIYIRGDSVCRGYLNRPELTAENFIKNPFPGEQTSFDRLYRTGNRGKYLPGGDIVITGRSNGHERLEIADHLIEPDEIRFHLLAYQGIKEAVVVSDNGPKEEILIAYYEKFPGFLGSLAVTDLKRFLSERLPAYMIPVKIIELEKIPLTSTGQPDRSSLSYLDQGAFVEPRTPTEKKLSALWSKILGEDHLNVTSDFFQLGGNSIKALLLVSEINEAFNLSLNLTHFFEHPTIKEFGVFLDEKGISSGSTEKQESRFSINISRDELDRLNQTYPGKIQDVYPLSPMQEGMLFHWLADKNSSVYFEQFSYRLHGNMDVALVEKSLNQLFQRYDILKTMFVHEGFERPLQVVLADRQVEFYHNDIRSWDHEKREEFIRQFKEKDIQRSFDLEEDVLMRAAVIQPGDAEYEFTWSFHHILVDGWCVNILIADFFEIYNSYLEDREYHLAPVTPYRDYIQWLEKQDLEVSANFWANYLEGYNQVSPIARLKSPKPHLNEYKREHIMFTLDKEKTFGLNQLASRNHVTVNTIMKSLWAIMLARYTEKDEVVFGSVVSGRPPELKGIQTMVGLFINTIPVRIRLRFPDSGSQDQEEKLSFSQLIKEVQEKANQCEPHHYYPLAKIQGNSLLKQDLIDHILVFENFPMAEKIQGIIDANEQEEGPRGNRLKVSNFEGFGQSNYDFFIAVNQEETLEVTFSHNGNCFEKESIQRMARHLGKLMDQVLTDDGIEINELAMLGEKETGDMINRIRNESDKSFLKDIEKDKPEVSKDQEANFDF